MPYGSSTGTLYNATSFETVPEPSTFALLCGAGVVGTAWVYRRRRSWRGSYRSLRSAPSYPFLYRSVRVNPGPGMNPNRMYNEKAHGKHLVVCFPVPARPIPALAQQPA